MGGLKAPLLTGNVELTPSIAKLAIDSYLKTISLWNTSLVKKGLQPVSPISPVGSSAYCKSDSPETRYGDVDYLVSFPVEHIDGLSQDQIRKNENEIKRKYEKDLMVFLNQSTEVDKYANADATNKGSPLLTIVKIPNNMHVQVDTIVTFPRYSSKEKPWMPARWTPERGLKGYTIGHLYTSLGNYFNMTIGDRGVTAKTIDEKRVSSRIRKNTKLKTISTNISTFLKDIAKEIAGEKYIENNILTNHSGMNPSNITIYDLAMGIKGVAYTLEDSGISKSASSTLSDILDLYEKGLQKSIEGKLSRGLSNKDYAKLSALNKEVLEAVKIIFN